MSHCLPEEAERKNTAMAKKNKAPTIQDVDYMEKTRGLAIMEQVAAILSARHEINIVAIRRKLKNADPQELYDNYLAPAINKIEEELEFQ